MQIGEMNYVVILIATVAAMVIGATWYSPVLFYKQWVEALGKTAKDMDTSKANVGYAITAFAWLLAAFILANFIDYANATTWMEGLKVGIWAWFGFVATTSAINGVFAGRSWRLWLIDNGYHLVSLSVMGAILAHWA